MQAPASVRRAFRAANPGASCKNPYDTALPQAPTGPRAAVRDCKPPAPAVPARRRENEVFHMVTITKLRKKIERVDALHGWRMRWYMQ
jgi:hypothetical protein